MLRCHWRQLWGLSRWQPSPWLCKELSPCGGCWGVVSMGDKGTLILAQSAEPGQSQLWDFILGVKSPKTESRVTHLLVSECPWGLGAIYTPGGTASISDSSTVQVTLTYNQCNWKHKLNRFSTLEEVWICRITSTAHSYSKQEQYSFPLFLEGETCYKEENGAQEGWWIWGGIIFHLCGEAER